LEGSGNDIEVGKKNISRKAAKVQRRQENVLINSLCLCSLAALREIEILKNPQLHNKILFLWCTK
jgi:hypothetical protein